ncbi:MAG: hypothetical protein JXQ71_12605, partial [Verrucomicrobia bacterium]|nr:hypothetical protein [Verrucomicrobiota bacterium]
MNCSLARIVGLAVLIANVATPASAADTAPESGTVWNQLLTGISRALVHTSRPGALAQPATVDPDPAVSVPMAVQANVLPARDLAQLYWPMHDGDWRLLEATILGEYMSLYESFEYDWWEDVFVLDSEDGEIGMGYENGNVVWYFIRLYVPGYGTATLDLNPPLVFLKGSALLNGSAWTSRSTATFEGYPITVSGSFSITKEGTDGKVTIPLGTYLDCRKLNVLSLTVSAMGYTERLSAQGFVMAPVIGYIKEAIVYSTGAFAGWGVLTQGVVDDKPVGGIAVVEITPPTVTITEPRNNLAVSNRIVLVKGTATDKSRVTNVWLQICGGRSFPTTTANQWTNWTAQAELEPGTNILCAWAADASGNSSAVVTNRVIYVLSDRLTLGTNPPAGGTVRGVANGQMLE